MMPELVQLHGDQSLNLALTAGDDYELCVTIAPEVLKRLAPDIQAQLVVVGQVVKTPGLSLIGADLTGMPPGFDHFGRLV